MLPLAQVSAEGTTFTTPLGLWFTLWMGFLILLLPRRYALVPLFILTCWMTMGQRVIVLTLDFTMLRILVLFGWARLFLHGEIRGIKFNVIDKLLLCWVASSILTYTLLWQTSEAFIRQLGLAYNAIGLYFLFRFLVRDLNEAKRAVRILAVLLLPVAVLMLLENATGRNSFAVFGGVPAMTEVRNGLLRCQGPFGHPILAGVFGATTMPLFMGLWWQGKGSRFVGAVGFLSSMVIVATSMSSTPLIAYLAGILGLAMWPLRNHMRAVRWGLIGMIAVLDLIMKAPVWFLIDRVRIFSGSSGYHRAMLVDRAIANLSDWWLIGTKSNYQWGYITSDVANQYVRIGVDGGLLTLALHLAIIAFCFGFVGKSMRALQGGSPREPFFLWTMGVALFTHVVAFFGISYWDQIIVIWYLLLAVIATAGSLFILRPIHVTTLNWESPTRQLGSRSTLSPSSIGSKLTCDAWRSDTRVR